MLPGILSWGTIALLIVLSWLFPVGIAIFIILFDTYWLLKTIYLSLHLRLSFKAMRQNLKINWLEKLISLNLNYRKIYHMVILPFYKEPYKVSKETLETLYKSNYPKDNLIIVLAVEERAGQESQETALRIEKEYKDKFFKFLITTHPDNLEGEIRGKGSNESWAIQKAKDLIIDPLKIPYEDILVSVLDIDTQIFPEYFGILTYNFFTCENPQKSQFQPVPLFTNNIYQAPALARVISFSATFWHLTQQSRPHRLTSFSSHAIPFKALAEVGFWKKNIVSEDSHIFWQSYVHFNGDWRVVPINYPVSMDANVANTFWQTMKNQYKQQQRWAWGGCENIPFLLTEFTKNKKISFYKKLNWSFNYIEGFHSWATNTIIIFTLGWLPIVIGGPVFRLSILSYSLPKITSYIMNAAMIGIASSAVLGILLLPPRPEWFKKKHYFLYIIQWLLTPITLILFGSIPALDSQTRGILGGKYKLGFWVTPKHRDKK